MVPHPFWDHRLDTIIDHPVWFVERHHRTNRIVRYALLTQTYLKADLVVNAPAIEWFANQNGVTVTPIHPAPWGNGTTGCLIIGAT